MLVRSADSWLLTLAVTLMWLTFANALPSAVICAQEAEGPAAGVSGTLVDGAAAPPAALEPHAASNVVAPKAAIASCHRRLTCVYCRLTVAV
jgi:hypothetical protein